MANTFGTPIVKRGREQFQGMFKDIWTIKIPVTDQDAIADDVSVDITATVPGVAVGDICLFVGTSKSQSDANAGITVDAWVSAADTVTVRFTNVDATTDAYDADTLNNGYVYVVLGTPNW